MSKSFILELSKSQFFPVLLKTWTISLWDHLCNLIFCHWQLEKASRHLLSSTSWTSPQLTPESSLSIFHIIYRQQWCHTFCHCTRRVLLSRLQYHLSHCPSHPHQPAPYGPFCFFLPPCPKANVPWFKYLLGQRPTSKYQILFKLSSAE